MGLYRKFRLKGSVVAASVLLGVGLLAPAAHTQVQTVNVDCTQGDTIAAALMEATPLVVVIQGTCNENIRIAKDDVTLVAGPAGGTIDGPDPNADTVLVVANRVTIAGLTLTGGRHGVNAAGAGRLTVRNCTVHNTGVNGINFFQGSDGTVNACTVQNNPGAGVGITSASATIVSTTSTGNGRGGIVLNNGGHGEIGRSGTGNTVTNNTGSGVGISLGSSASITDNTITNNTGLGVGIFLGSSASITGNSIRSNTSTGVTVGQADAQLTGNTVSENVGGGILTGNSRVALVGGNTIDSNGAFGVFATGSSRVHIGPPSSVFIGPQNVNSITANRGGGVFVVEGSTLTIGNATISGNTSTGVKLAGSSANIFASSVTANGQNGIWIVFGASVVLSSPTVTVTGNTGFGLFCQDSFSHFQGDVSGISGNTAGDVSPGCTGF